MAREYEKKNAQSDLAKHQANVLTISRAVIWASAIVCSLFLFFELEPLGLFLLGCLIPAAAGFAAAIIRSQRNWVEGERIKESVRRGGKPVLGLPPQRDSIQKLVDKTRSDGKVMVDKYLVGFELDSGAPIWVSDDDLCTHAAVFAKTGVGKTLWLEGMMFQQMARGRASGFTFIDAKRDLGTLADIIIMALITGRIEDLIVVDPFDPVCCYNFVFTTQRADVKARKVLRCGLPPTSDQSTTKHYDRLAADAVYRVVRAMESFGLAWSVRDIAVALSAFNFAYPRLRQLLHERGEKQAMVELGHLAGSYRNAKGKLDSLTITDNLRGISSELHSISNSEAGEMFCAPRADLSLTDAILRGKMVYYMLPRLEEAESAARMVKVFREDLEVSIGEITSNRNYRLEDPHMVIIDEGASTFGPTWANLFELARKGRFALMFGAQSVGGLMDETMGLSEQFYERVMANVNLRVIMRVGDNRTAMDMSEWIGKVTIQKKTLATGLSSGVNSRELTKNLEINRRSSDSFRDAVTVADDEEDLVSQEELKHEMSAEKGLAWFDVGDGRLRKGRTLWFNSEPPPQWLGREFLVRYETVEADEIGLAEWVDEHILQIERSESEQEAEYARNQSEGGPPRSAGPGAPSGPGKSGGTTAPSPASAPSTEIDEGGSFRFNLMRGFRGKPRARTFVAAVESPAPEPAQPTPEKSSQEPEIQKEPLEKKSPAKSVKTPVGAAPNVSSETTSEKTESKGGAVSAPAGKQTQNAAPAPATTPQRGGLKLGGPKSKKPGGGNKEVIAR